MVLEFFKGGADSQLEEIEGLIIQMLLDCRHTFDLAINSLIGGTEPGTVGKQISKTDVGINRAQRKVRKELVVHASVRGAGADLPMVLSSMSIVAPDSSWIARIVLPFGPMISPIFSGLIWIDTMRGA